MVSVYETFDVEPLIDLAHKVVQRGYTALKVVFVPYSEPLEGVGKDKTLRQANGKTASQRWRRYRHHDRLSRTHLPRYGHAVYQCRQRVSAFLL